MIYPSVILQEGLEPEKVEPQSSKEAAIDPVMQKYMDMVQKQKEKEKEVIMFC